SVYCFLLSLAAPDLQIRAQSLADLQIGVEDRSQPVHTFIEEEGYGDLEIARGRAAIWRLHSAKGFTVYCFLFRFSLGLAAPELGSERNLWPISRSAWRTGRDLSLLLLGRRDSAIWRSPGVELQSGDCTQRKSLPFTVFCLGY